MNNRENNEENGKSIEKNDSAMVTREKKETSKANEGIKGEGKREEEENS